MEDRERRVLSLQAEVEEAQAALQERSIALVRSSDEQQRLRKALLDAEIDMQVGWGSILDSQMLICCCTPLFYPLTNISGGFRAGK